MIGYFKKSAALIALTCAMTVSAQATPVFDLPSPENYRNASWSFGEIFTVGGSDISVTALGAFDADGDGFVSTGGIPVGIFRESDDALLVSATVLSGDTLISGFRYTNITPLTLLAGVAYRVVAVNLNDLYNIDFAFTVDPAITRTGYGYCQTTTLTSCDGFAGSERIWMANFLIDGVVPAPEPGILGLFGLGLAGLGLALRRRKNC